MPELLQFLVIRLSVSVPLLVVELTGKIGLASFSDLHMMNRTV